MKKLIAAAILFSALFAGARPHPLMSTSMATAIKTATTSSLITARIQMATQTITTATEETTIPGQDSQETDNLE